MTDEQYKKVIDLAQKDIKEELDRQINARLINEEFVEKNFISKDKIKAKIEEYTEILKSSIINDRYKVEVNNIIRVLQELLEEEE